MIVRWVLLRLFPLAFFVLSFFALACGAGPNGNEPALGGPDSGGADADAATSPLGDAKAAVPDGASDASDANDASANDATTSDDGSDAALDAGSLDAGPPPTALASGPNLALWGITADGYAIYSTNDVEADGGIHAQYYAVPTSGSGGSPILITEGDYSSSDFYLANVSVQHSTVFIESNLSNSKVFDSEENASILAWTAASGAHTLTSAGMSASERASEDGSWVLYFDGSAHGAEDGGVFYDLYVAAPDGSNKTALVQGTQPGGGQWMFAGSNVLVVLSPSFTATAFEAPGWTANPLVQNVDSSSILDVDSTGTNALIETPTPNVDSSFTIQVIPVAGGAGRVIDSASNTFTGSFTHDGSKVVYSVYGSGLITSPVVNPSPLALTSNGANVGAISSLAPNDGWIMWEESSTEDIFLNSATQPSSDLVSDAGLGSLGNGGGFGGFTADSSFAFFASLGGALQVASTSASDGGATQLAANGSGAAYAVAPTSGARMVFTANGTATEYNSSFNSSGYAFDLQWDDLATGVPPLTIASNVVQSFQNWYGETEAFGITPAGDHVVYVGGQADAGTTNLTLYAASVP
jgi:hypothetical protein